MPIPEVVAVTHEQISYLKTLLDPAASVEQVIGKRNWVGCFIELVLAFSLLDTLRMTGFGLPSQPLPYLAILIGMTGCMTLIYWPLYTLVALYAGPKLFKGRGRYRDCMLVLAAAARPVAVAAVILIPLEIFILKPYLPGGMPRILNDHYNLAWIGISIQYFLALWWIALAVWGGKIVHRITWVRAIVGAFLFPILFIVINLIRYSVLL